jgi:hypothetical protein
VTCQIPAAVLARQDGEHHACWFSDERQPYGKDRRSALHSEMVARLRSLTPIMAWAPIICQQIK